MQHLIWKVRMNRVLQEKIEDNWKNNQLNSGSFNSILIEFIKILIINGANIEHTLKWIIDFWYSDAFYFNGRIEDDELQNSITGWRWYRT